jgi:hypothetical protein
VVILFTMPKLEERDRDMPLFFFDENHAHTRCIISFRLDHCPKLEAQCFEIPVFIDIGQEKQHTL